MDQLVNSESQAEYQPVRPRNNSPYSGNEDHSSCPTEIVSDIAASTIQSVTETANFTRMVGHTFQGLSKVGQVGVFGRVCSSMSLLQRFN